MNRSWTQFIFITFVAIISLGLRTPALRAAETEDMIVFVRNLTQEVGHRDREIFITINGGVERLTHNMVPDLYPSLSPDCTKITYTSDFGNGFDICVMDIDSLKIDRLTFSMESDRYPTWSPDGRKIAFSSERDGDVNIYIMDADGENMVQLTDNPGDDIYPDWSPDGRYIIFHNYLDTHISPVLGQPTPPSSHQIYLIDVKSGHQRKHTEDLAGSLHPRWSPDGTQIAFHSGIRQELPSWRYRPQLCLIGTDGSGLEILTMDDDGILYPTFSPDGKQVAFSSRKDDNWDIYSMDMETGVAIRLTHDPDGDYQPEWSPTGDKIAFVSYRGDGEDIYIMDSDGGQLTNLTRSDVSEGMISWSPDGNKIAFVRYFRVNDSVQSIICVMDSDGNNVMELADPPFHNLSPVWSPQGDRIAFVNYPERGVDRSYIYIMDMDGRNRQLLFDEPSGLIEDISWSPDGTQMAFIYRREHSPHEIRLLDIATGQATTDVLTRKLGQMDTPHIPRSITWLPDGQKLAFAAAPPPPDRSEVFRDGLFFMDVDGNILRTIWENPDLAFGRFSWSPDGQTIIFSNNDNLYSLDLTSEAVILFMEDADSPDWKDPAHFYDISPVGNLITTWGRTKSVLLQNYPNPFNPDTWIPYQLADDSEAAITIYDPTGQVVRALNLGHQRSGHHIAHWDGKDCSGQSLASGIYFYVLRTNDGFSDTKKMVLLK